MRARRLVLCLTVLLASVAPAEPPVPPERELANVAAFARLYGVARYFYPSDAAATLDWNRFAVLGVSRVRPAADDAALRNTLLRLFGPLGPGFEVAARLPSAGEPPRNAGPLVAWRYLGPGFAGNPTGGPYRGKRTHRTTAAIDGFANVMQTLPADALRGRAIRMRARVRASVTDANGAAALWLRVDRPDKATGFFDNMHDRPVREPLWKLYQIEGTVADDAVAVAFGVMAFGGVTADFDAVELSVRGPGGEWSVVPVADAGFEAASGAGRQGWFRAGTSRTVAASRPAEGAPEGRQYLRLAAPPPDAAETELFPDAPPVPGAHADFALGSGLSARVPLALADEEARTNPARRQALVTLTGALAGVSAPAAEPGPDERLADVVVAWSVFRHFYPYWPQVGVDWEALLAPQLATAFAARTRAEQRTALRILVAGARDGHGFVADSLDKAPQAWLPVRFVAIGERLVVAASSSPDVPVGTVVSAIDGVPATARFEGLMRLQSGTEAWRETRVASELALGPKGSRVRLALDGDSRPREAWLAFDGDQPPAENRPEPVAELEPGIWYVDLTRAAMAKVALELDAISGARGIVFDVRGYPGDAGMRVLPHLLASAETDRWMHIARIVGPLGESTGWQSLGWNLSPEKPAIRGRVVFLTDGRAISYAESVLGYVADRGLGTIVGTRTAGTNGNVVSFTTPGGFLVGFTGMLVTRHDGRSPRHLVSIEPDVVVAPTVEGLRAGRDEVLERGLAVARAGTPAKRAGR